MSANTLFPGFVGAEGQRRRRSRGGRRGRDLSHGRGFCNKIENIALEHLAALARSGNHCRIEAVIGGDLGGCRRGGQGARSGRFGGCSG
jgi:hypothetical protein